MKINKYQPGDDVREMLREGIRPALSSQAPVKPAAQVLADQEQTLAEVIKIYECTFAAMHLAEKLAARIKERRPKPATQDVIEFAQGLFHGDWENTSVTQKVVLLQRARMRLKEAGCDLSHIPASVDIARSEQSDGFSPYGSGQTPIGPRES